MQKCPNCGEENPKKFRLCGFCGAQLAVAPRRDVRKTVSIVFCDLKGSTDLGERLDSESLREMLVLYFEEMRAILERHGGMVEKYIGDAVMAVFGLPKLHEDDALRAVRAAVEMQDGLESLNDDLERRWGLRLANRTGVNTGEVVAGDVSLGQRLVTGDAVNVAARLEQAAPERQVLIGASTYELVRNAAKVEELAPLRLKGKKEPVPAYRVISVADGEGVARRTDTPLVGRRHELDRMSERFRRVVAKRASEAVTLVGQAGIGKSRLVAEFLRRNGDQATSLTGKCLPYGDGITFWPLVEIAKQAAGIQQEDDQLTALGRLASLIGDEDLDVLARVAEVIGLTRTTVSVDETIWAARKLVEIIARSRPLILIFEDIHWAEPTFLDLIEHLTGTTSAPLFVLATARDELLEERPEWMEGRANTERFTLAPLSNEESAEVIENLLGSVRLPHDLRSRIVDGSGGNAFFVEQMLAMLEDDGVLERVNQRVWKASAELEQLAAPPSISALLSARLDRLSAEEQSVVQRGSVIGQFFNRQAVVTLSPEPLRATVDQNLSSLTRKQLVAPQVETFLDDETFGFVHMLARDAAYKMLLKKDRARLHEGFANWLQEKVGARVSEYLEILGYHLEQAFKCRVEAAKIDDETRGLGDRAAEALTAAGQKAFARGDMPAAASLLGRAAAVLEAADPDRLALMPDLSEALIEIGNFSAADDLLHEARELALAIGDERMQAALSLAGMLLRYAIDPETQAEEVQRGVEAAISVLEPARDHVSLARAWRLIGSVHGNACRFGAAEVVLGKAVHHARAAGDRRQETRTLPSYALSALYGPTPVPQAIARCEEILDQAQGDRRAKGLVLGALAHLNAMSGRIQTARQLYRESRGIFEELGAHVLAASSALDSGDVEMLAGDLVAAENEFRRGFDELIQMGEKNFLSTTVGLLAQCLCMQGRFDEAEDMCEISKNAAAPDDLESQALWRSVQAKGLAHKGLFDEAKELAATAVELINSTDSPVMKAATLLDRTEVLELAGSGGEAASLIKEAISLYAAKGNLVSTERARAKLAALVEAPIEVGLPTR
ncbi:MAG: AAA family ATPase [Actinobacteria bacterium]|nr:AAA family ATPase [Actinomycetota bacterium]